MRVFKDERRNLIASRWLALVCWGAIGGIVTAILDELLIRLFQSLSDGMSRIPEQWMFPALATLGVACSWPFGAGRWRAFFGLKHFWSYPPLWIGILSSFVAWQTMRWTSVPLSDSLSNMWWTIHSADGVFWLLCVAAGAWLFVQRRGAVSARSTKEVPTTAGKTEQVAPRSLDGVSDFASLRRWLLNDKEISQKCDDQFGHWEIAARIRTRLEHPVEAPTMALIGRVGSGKSSVRELVMRQLEEQSRVRMVSLSLWPYETPEAAVRGILSTLVRELGREVNALPLRGLSDDYAAAIERSVEPIPEPV